MLTIRPKTASQTGFTLIEVLVAMLILSIGLLGMAGLQSLSFKMNQSAHLSSQATFLSYDMIDRMRANRKAALNGDYNQDLGCDIPAASTVVADQDRRSWLQEVCGMTDNNGDHVPGLLPQEGDKTGAAIDVDSSGIATITLKWFDARWSDRNQGANTNNDQIRSVKIQAEL